jgi:hypothetical protein
MWKNRKKDIENNEEKQQKIEDKENMTTKEK